MIATSHRAELPQPTYLEPPTQRASPDGKAVVRGLWLALGPAFVAAIAYVDPGNVAVNMTAGAQYGYLLVWAIVLANAMAGLVQFLSAKVGLVTGKSLPEIIREHLPRSVRIAYWAQAEIVAVATDMAEVLGGAIALNILFNLPLLLGGLITGVVSMGLLAIQNKRGQLPFERVITALIFVIAIGFVAGLFVKPPSLSGTIGGLIPRFSGVGSLMFTVGIFGATIMPHVVYLHSALARDRHGRAKNKKALTSLLKATKFDVTLAMLLAGGINIAMLLLAATSLRHASGVDTLIGAHAAVQAMLGNGIALLFAIALLVSGLASTSVGCYAGAVIMQGLLHRKIPLPLRRVITMLPALILLSLRLEPTLVLVISQVVLSFGIPFAVIPLVIITTSKKIMSEQKNKPLVTWLASGVTAVVIGLNGVLVGLMAVGKSN